MRARDVAPTRFDRARAEALALAARLAAGQRGAVVLAAPRPVLLAPLTGDRGTVETALRAAEPWDAAGDVAAAVTLAAAQRPGPDGQIIVWTDAARGPLPALVHVTYRIVGTSDDNVGITAFRVLRDPQQTEALVRVTNDGGALRRVPLEVSLGDTVIVRAAIDVPAQGSRTTVFPVSGTGVLRARIRVRDMLPDDDQATAVLDPTPLPSVLLVSRGNAYLERVLRVLPVARALETRDVDPATWTHFGVVILDRMETGPLPPGNYLIIGVVPPGLPVSASDVVTRPEVATWDREDPVLRFVDLAGVRIDRALALAPDGGRTLAAGQAPLLWAYDGRGVRVLLLAFALEDSDLGQRVAFPILMSNSLAWLGGGIADARVGDAVQVPSGGAGAATLVGADGQRRSLVPTAGVFVLPPFTRAGLYRLSTGGGTREFAVAIDSAGASVIRPGRAPALGGVAAVASGSTTAGVPATVLVRVSLWPWLVLVGFVALFGEWTLATRRHGGDA